MCILHEVRIEVEETVEHHHIIPNITTSGRRYEMPTVVVLKKLRKTDERDCRIRHGDK